MSGNGRGRTTAARRDEHAEDSRRAILAAARRVFADKGYAAASLEDMVGPARLTKGALYHHFRNKAAVLEAVYTEMEEELVRAVGAAVAAAGDDPWQRMLAALDAFLEASSEPAYVRIVLRDAPPVIGRERGRDIDQAVGLTYVEALIRSFVEEEGASSLSIPAAARILIAATGDVAMSMAHAADPERVRAEGREVLVAMLEGLRRRSRATTTT
jgi:AcrR family transcriptional regulator